MKTEQELWWISIYNNEIDKKLIDYKTNLTREDLLKLKSDSDKNGQYTRMGIAHRWYNVPVEKMTNADKVKAMAERIHLFGGLGRVFVEFGAFTFGFSNKFRNGDNNRLYLYSIGMSDLLFTSIDKEEKNKSGKIEPDYNNIWEIPINHFSESFLYSVFMFFKAMCKKQLTFEAYAEVLYEVGELPEIEK